MSDSQQPFGINTSFEATALQFFPPRSISPIIPPPVPPKDVSQYSLYNVQPKSSPITYLIETEEEYIEDLQCLLQQVTRSWDLDNPLPPELEIIFSVLGGIHKLNNEFCLKLKQVTSTKGFDNTLIEWVEEMERPYVMYFQNYVRGIDSWPEIDNNLKLQQVLNNISAQRNQPVTLNFFLEMPLKRIHHYKKLYMRMFKSLELGRSDYDKLELANKRIGDLIELGKKAKETNKPRADISLPVPLTVMHTTTVVHTTTVTRTTISPTNSQEGTTIAKIKSPKIVVNWTLTGLEDQLDTSNVCDLFTKQPKTVNVVLSPPKLPFKREILLHDDLIVILSDGDGSNEHRAHVKAHLFLLTDLLLICQQLTSEEKELNPTKEFRLLYPPLSGRHLSISDIYDSRESLLSLMVLQKESLVIIAENNNIKRMWLKRVTQMIEFAKNAASLKLQINTNASLPDKDGGTPQFLTSPERKLTKSPSTGNLLMGQTLSPQSQWSPGNRSSSMKIGLPSSPLSMDPSLLRSRSQNSTKSNGAPNSKNYAPTEGNQKRSQPKQRSNSMDSTISMASLASVSSIGSFTETIHQTPPCEVSRWVEREWILITKKCKCIVEIKMTSSNNPCWAVILESNGRMVLNAWIHPTTLLRRESPYSISVACEMGLIKEYYLVSVPNPIDSDRLFTDFLRAKNHGNYESSVQGLISRSSSLQNSQPIQPMKEIEQMVTDVMDAKIKLLLQNNYGIWTNLGWGHMKLSLETPSHRKRIVILSDKDKKSKLVDTFVGETGVGRVGKYSVTFKINNVNGSNSIIYMMQMKDDASAKKAFDIMRTKQQN